MTFEEDRKIMLEFHLKSRGIKKQEVLNAFNEIPRENFVPENVKSYSYADLALPIGSSATISQPFIIALMIQMLNPKKDDLILEIGTGSGYQSALLSKLCRKVISLDINKKLIEKAKKNLENTNIKNVEILNVDGTDFEPNLKFDRIIVSAATPKISQNLINILKNKGVILAPEGGITSQKLNKYQKIYGKLELIEENIPVTFVPLQGKYGF